MKDYLACYLRNIAMIGHGSEGKTTLTEAMLFNAGAIDRMGRVEDGSTTTDYDPEEIKRAISISAAAAPFDWKDCKINVIDLPGYFDFVGETVGALTAVEGALILVGSQSGLTVGAEKAWAQCEKRGLARAFVINQMDRENASFDKVLAQLVERYGSNVVPLQLPIIAGGAFKGVVNVLENVGYEGAGKAAKQVPVPADMQSAVDTAREAIVEAAAAADEALMEKYFDQGELSPEEMQEGLRSGITQGAIVPVFACSGVTGIGVCALMDAVVDFMPSPDGTKRTGINPKNDAEETRSCNNDEPFSALVFKTVADPFVGKLSLFRVVSGVLTAETALYNANAERLEKAGTLYTMRGKKQTPVTKLIAGDIGALAKLQFTATGHTLCDNAKPIRFPAIEFPQPCISMAVYAKKEGEEDKVFSGLSRLMEEDPTVRVEKNTDTVESVLSGLGELHIEVISRKLQSKFGVEAILQDPKIPYRETIRKGIKAEGRHKKQTGGHGQFGHVWVEFEPILDATTDFEFVDKVVGGVVPRGFIPAVEKGLRENLHHGVLAGFPVVNLRATLYDGSYHAVDSSEMAFKIAARLAFKKLADASPVLLEPINHVEVMVPDEYMGDVIGDMNRRRGRIMGMNQVEGGQQVVAEVPLAEMFKYATDLRSMTQARGSFTMAFERYEEVPAQDAKKIIESAKKEEEEEE